MNPKRQVLPGTLPCIWCGTRLGKSTPPKIRPTGFCRRRCEIEAHFWLFQELCAIEITYRRNGRDDTDDR
jgi:hypothetical protein